MGYLLDTNIFNRVLDGRMDLRSLPVSQRLYATPVQYAELAQCPDLRRREELLEVFQRIAPEIEPVSFSLDVEGAGLDQGVFRDEYVSPAILIGLNALRNRANNLQDALIAEVALLGDHTLVTADRNLVLVAKDHGISVHAID